MPPSRCQSSYSLCLLMTAGGSGKFRWRYGRYIPESNTKLMWEGACSRRRSFSQHQWRLIHRLREQAPSHRVTQWPVNTRP
ncbi:hypothetical protein C1894_07990 [Pseudomonas sp. FW305-3-2-15-E-TSA2]|nr:hypothetical protein C1895_02590 [Pseudomonas sp. FW305-3-2-15-E-TSA4]POA43728.1 hypothetical protein C1894_07990 [Pseudomonas sp. FW305-3-2-15-E-TSA2]